VPILPTVHGTSLENAWKICYGGFATLSKLDTGYFGSGIYFTTYYSYAESYFMGFVDPAVLISYVIPGNSYPVIEHPHESPSSFKAGIIKVGYQSHYIRVKPDGMPVDSNGLEEIYDELVINQETQVCPAYVYELKSPERVKKLRRRQKKERGTSEDALLLDVLF